MSSAARSRSSFACNPNHTFDPANAFPTGIPLTFHELGPGRIKRTFVTSDTLERAISAQAEINRFLARNGIKDLVGDYGELLIHKALGGKRKNAVNRGFDIDHDDLRKIEVKTRKYELRESGGVTKESRAAGFSGKENSFDWLAHVVLDIDFSVVSACLVHYKHAWPEIVKTTYKIGFSKSSRLPSSRDITSEVRAAQMALGYPS